MTGFRIRTTPGWWELPLDPATRDAEIAAFVAEARSDASPEVQREVTRMLRQTAKAAAEIGAGLCAEYAMLSAEGQLIGANLLVTLASVALPEDLEDHAAAVAERGFPAPTDPPPAECGVVELPEAGPAVRVRCEHRAAGPAGGLERSLRVQFFVPVPGASQTAVVTFSSPLVSGHEPTDELVELFDTIAGTFCFVEEPHSASS